MSERANPTALPPEVLEAFTSAAVMTLRELTQFEATPLAVPRTMTSQLADTFVLATVRLVRAVPGNMTLVMSTETTERLAARYLPAGTELTEDIVNDVAGEFANVIAGQAKTILKGTPHHFLLSLPVVSRQGMAEKQPGHAITLTFESGQIQLCVELPRSECT